MRIVLPMSPFGMLEVMLCFLMIGEIAMPVAGFQMDLFTKVEELSL